MLTVGIAGGTGSGKTTVVRKLLERFPGDQVAVLSQDSYYRDNSHLPLSRRQQINFDHPDAIEFELLIDHLKRLKGGESVQQPVYSYLTCTRSPETTTICPRKVVIVEGILILTQPILRELLNIKVFVFADADDRLIRVLERDIRERGRNVQTILDRYQQIVKPMHLQFIEPSQRYADLIVPGGGKNKVAIDILTATIEKNLQ